MLCMITSFALIPPDCLHEHVRYMSVRLCPDRTLCVSSRCATTSDVVQQPLEHGHAEGDLGRAEARLLGPPEPGAVVVQQGHLPHADLSLAQAKRLCQLSAKHRISSHH